MIKKWQAAILSALLVSSASVMTTVHAEKGVTTATRIQRSEYKETKSVTTWHRKERSSDTSKGVTVSGPDISILIFPSMEGFPFIDDDRRAPKLASYDGPVKKKDLGFYENGVLAMVKSGKNWGIIGKDGTVTLSPSYKILIPKRNGIFKAGNKKRELQFIDKQGNSALPPSSDGNPLWYKEKGLYGFKNSDGSVLISPRYKDVLAPFSEGIAVVKTTNGENAGIDENGRVLFTTPFEDIRPFQYGVAEYRRKVNHVKGGTFLGLIIANNASAKATNEYGAYGSLSHDTKRGFINRNGEIVIDSKNDIVYPMTPYGAFVKNGGLTSFISPKGKVIITPGRYDIEDVDTEDGYAVLEDDGLDKEGLFDLETGTQLMGFYHDEITLLGHGRAVIEKGKQQYLFDIENDRVITALPAGVDLMPFNDETVTWMYKKGTYYGIIDEDGHILYEDTKDPLTRAGQFRHGLAPAKKGKKWGVIRPDGTWLVKPAYDDIGLL